MQIIRIETLRPVRQRNVCFVRLHTDEGISGLGESFFGAASVETYIHEAVAPVLLGIDSPRPLAVAEALRSYVGYQAGGVETRGNGAIDGALWDLLGKLSGLPLVDLLGGPVRDRVRAYNTCAGPAYVSQSTFQHSSNWGVGSTDSTDPLDDLVGFLTRPGELALELSSEGFFGMKIWPFDIAAERSGGLLIDRADLAAGLRILEKIRDAVGDRIEIMIEMHGLWSPRPAVQIGRALEPFLPFWVEDPVRPDSLDGLQHFAGSVGIDIAAGETLTGRRAFRPALEAGALQIAAFDIGWTGGLSESIKIASMADTYGVPFAPHDCTGPVSLALATHLVCSQKNGLIQETSRAFYKTWYEEFAVGFPDLTDGWLSPSSAAGHGVELEPEITDRSDVQIRESSL